MPKLFFPVAALAVAATIHFVAPGEEPGEPSVEPAEERGEAHLKNPSMGPAAATEGVPVLEVLDSAQRKVMEPATEEVLQDQPSNLGGELTAVEDLDLARCHELIQYEQAFYECLQDLFQEFEIQAELEAAFARLLCRDIEPTLFQSISPLIRAATSAPAVLQPFEFLCNVSRACRRARVEFSLAAFVEGLASMDPMLYQRVRSGIDSESILLADGGNQAIRLCRAMAKGTGDQGLIALMKTCAMGRTKASPEQVNECLMGATSSLSPGAEWVELISEMIYSGKYAVDASNSGLGATTTSLLLHPDVIAFQGQAKFLALAQDLCNHPSLGLSACVQLSARRTGERPKGISAVEWDALLGNSERLLGR